MVEIFIIPAVLIGVTSKVWKTGISLLPTSRLLASLISEESESQPNYFNRIFSFSRKKKKCRNKNRPLRNVPLFPINTLLSVVHKFVNYHEINGRGWEGQLHDDEETEDKISRFEVPLLTAKSSYVIVKSGPKSNFEKASLLLSPGSAAWLGVLHMVIMTSGCSG